MNPRDLILVPALAAALATPAATVAQQPPEPVIGLPRVPLANLGTYESKKADGKLLVASCTAFAAKLRAQLGERAGPVSPGSVIAVLHLLQACTDEGSAAQVRRLLGLPDALQGARLAAALSWALPKDHQPTTKTTNTIWLDNGFQVPPADVLEQARLLGAQVQAMDFSADAERARRFINYQVAAATNGRIPELLDAGAVHDETSLVLTNTFWFQDRWAQCFPARDTAPRPFQLRSGASVEVPTMMASERFQYAETEAAQVVRLEFEGSSMVFEIVLPKGDADVSEAVDAAEAAAFQRHPQRNVELWLPKFRAGAKHDLSRALRALGLPPTLTAAPGLVPAGKETLEVTAVVQQTWIEIDEDGAEAAAATAAVVRCAGLPVEDPSPQVTMRCDRPFAYSLRDGRTGLTWMSGTFEGPAAAPAR